MFNYKDLIEYLDTWYIHLNATFAFSNNYDHFKYYIDDVRFYGFLMK